ncbi:hypothetical protein ACHAPA_010260 [Fusarium lateritium]
MPGLVSLIVGDERIEANSLITVSGCKRAIEAMNRDAQTSTPKLTGCGRRAHSVITVQPQNGRSNSRVHHVRKFPVMSALTLRRDPSPERQTDSDAEMEEDSDTIASEEDDEQTQPEEGGSYDHEVHDNDSDKTQ